MAAPRMRVFQNDYGRKITAGPPVDYSTLPPAWGHFAHKVPLRSFRATVSRQPPRGVGASGGRSDTTRTTQCRLRRVRSRHNALQSIVLAAVGPAATRSPLLFGGV